MKKSEQDRTERELARLIDRFRSGFVDGTLTLEEVAEIVERLRAFDTAAIRRIADMLTAPDEETRYTGITLAQELGDSRLVAPLRRMLRNPDCSDEEKVLAITTLADLGAPVDEATFRRVVSDPEAVMKRALANMLSKIEDPVQVEYLLRSQEHWTPEMQSGYVYDILAPLADRRLSLLLNALLYSEHDEVVIAAIDAIERLKEPAYIPLLEERAAYDHSPRVRHAAENAALRLRMRVGAPESTTALPPWSVCSDLPLAYCLLSTMDGSGTQVLLLSRHLPGGEMRLVDILFNDHQGIKDCFSAIVSEEELDEIIEGFAGIEFVDISLERARDTVARAYQVTLEARRRPPVLFPVWRGWLEGSDTEPPEEVPLPVIEPSMRDQLLAECTGLLDLDEFEYWFFNPDEVQEFVPSYRRLLRRRQAEVGEPAFEALIDRAIEAVVNERYRRLLPARLREQAWLLRQLYEDEEVELSMWALVAADAIEEGIIVQHPLLREMMAYSLANAAGCH